MNFQLAAIGHSFKGSMAYYLHDKRQDEAGPHPDSADRVAWTELRNLAAAAGPETATRMMISTAQSADELKAAAGVKNTGRKSTRGPVFAFSLQWRANEIDGTDRAEMTRVADHALKVLGIDHLQAVMIAHHDRDHPHVHIVVNRVDPTNGKATSIDGMKVKKLDAWANQYEHERGKIVSPNRAKKYEQIQAAKNAHPDPDKRRRYIEDKKRPQIEAAKRPAAPRATEQRPPSRGAMLKELGDAQKARHRQDWQEWAAKAKADRKAVYDRADAQKAAALAAFKESTRGDWAQHFKAERDRAAAFDARERSLSGVVKNALAAAKQQFRQQPEGGRGMLSLTFANVLDSATRRQTFDQVQELTKAQFTAAMKERRDAHLVALEIEKRRALIDQSAAIDKAKADMIERHDTERGKMREAWRQHYASRDAAAPGETYRTRKPHPLPVKDHQPMKDQFDKARLVETKLPPARAPHEDVRLSTPAPAPRPAGIIDPPHSDVKPVPVVDRTAAIEAEAKPSARRDWTQPTDTLPAPPPTPEAKPGVTDWSAKYKLTEAQRAAADQPTQRPDGPRMKP